MRVCERHAGLVSVQYLLWYLLWVRKTSMRMYGAMLTMTVLTMAYTSMRMYGALFRSRTISCCFSRLAQSSGVSQACNRTD